MAGNNEMKRRMKSVEDLRQMTRAMQLISQIKRSTAAKQLAASKYFFLHTMRTVNEIMIQDPDRFDRIFTLREKNAGDPWNVLINIISAESGMSGAYTLKLLRRGESLARSLQTKWREKGYVPEIAFRVYGRGLSRRLEEDGFVSEGDFRFEKNDPDYYMSQLLSLELLDDYFEEKYDEIYFVYMHMNNSVQSEPLYIRTLPADALGLQLLTRKLFSPEEMAEEDRFMQSLRHRRLSFAPDAEEVAKYLRSCYSTAMIFGILNEAHAAEHSWRMQAMESATNNADELLGKLKEEMNQKRQEEITEELNEIISGASSI